MTAGLRRGALGTAAVALLLGCAGLAAPSAAPEPVSVPVPTCERQEGVRELQVEHEGRRWPVRVYVPGGTEPIDALVLLHGGGGSAAKILDQSGALDVARDKGFALIVPEGVDQGTVDGKRLGLRWNSGKVDPMPVPRDDVAYLDVLAELARERMCAERVVAFGFSNGSQLAQRWGCESDVPAALITVAGSLHVDPGICRAGPPTLAWAGSEDRTYDPGDDGLEGERRTFDDALDRLAPARSCVLPRAARDTRRSHRTTCTDWDCEVPLRSCVIEGLGHGVPRSVPEHGADAVREGWEWFLGL